MNTKMLCWSVFVGGALCLSGCGPGYSATNLTGKVSVDGQAVTEGSITFIPTESGCGSGVRVFLRPDGTYSAKDVPLGTVRVTVIATKKTGNKTKGIFGEEVDEVASVIPASKSQGINVAVVQGQTVCNFEWESDKEPFHGPGSR